jgi:hypothetical protein
LCNNPTSLQDVMLYYYRIDNIIRIIFNSKI